MKVKTSWIVVGVMVCGLCAGSSPLQAQAPAIVSSAVDVEHEPWGRGVPLEEREAAREVFLEGNRLFKIPLFAQAVEQYTAALARWKHPAFHFNLALAQLNLGLDIDAHDNLEQAIRHGASPLGADAHQEARQQLREVERRLGKLRVSCSTPGAEVTLNGAPLFTGPGNREVWVKAHTHELTAKRASYVTKVKRVSVSAGAVETIDVPLHKLIEDRPWRVWKPWVVVGAGAVVAAAGGALHALSARDFGDYDNGFRSLTCADTGCTEQTIDAEAPGLNARLRSARLEQRLAVGGYIAGGAAVVLGAVLVYLNRPHLMEQEGGDPRGAVFSMVPVVSGDALGVSMTVSY